MYAQTSLHACHVAMNFGCSHSAAQEPDTAPDAQTSTPWRPTDIDTLTLTPLPVLWQEAPVLIKMCFICGTEPKPEMGSWSKQHFRSQHAAVLVL